MPDTSTNAKVVKGARRDAVTTDQPIAVMKSAN